MARHEQHDMNLVKHYWYPVLRLEELLDKVNEQSTPLERALAQRIYILMSLMGDDIEDMDDVPLPPRFVVGTRVCASYEAPEDWYEIYPDCEWPSGFTSVVSEFWYDTDLQQWRYELEDPNQELGMPEFYEDELEAC